MTRNMCVSLSHFTTDSQSVHFGVKPLVGLKKRF